MRQGDGSDLLGPGNPQSSDIGIIYVEPMDTRPDILKAINTQEITGRKQIAIVLLEQHKAFRQPVDFDGLKNVRRGLKAQLVFIASPGPGPANFAHQRNFPVYSSLETFRQALRTEGVQPANRRTKSKPGLLGFSSRKARPEQPAGQRAAQVSPLVSPAPQPQRPSGQPVQATPLSPLADRETLELHSSDQETSGSPGAAGLVADATSVTIGNDLGNDDALAPPDNPSLPTPTSQGSSTTGSSGGPVHSPSSRPLPESRSASGPSALILPSMPGTPKTTGRMSALSQGQAFQPKTTGNLSPTQKPPDAQVIDSSISPAPQQPLDTPVGGSGKLSATQRPPDPIIIDSSISPAPQQPLDTPVGGSGKLSATQRPPDPIVIDSSISPAAPNVPDAQNQPAGPTRRRNSGAIPIVVAGTALAGAATSGGPSAASSPASRANATQVPPTRTGPGGPGAGARAQSGLTQSQPPRSRRQSNRDRRRNLLLLALLLALVVFLIFSVVFASAHGGVKNLFTPSITAQVTITPASKPEQNSYLLQGLTTSPPDPARNEVLARILTTNPLTQKATHQATGYIPPTKAKGTLTFLNNGNTPVQINGGVLTDHNGVAISFGSVFIPATSPSSATTIGTAVNAGASGNIPALDISGTCCNNSNITVKNDAFTGGRDAIRVITSDDINNAANQVTPSLLTNAQNTLPPQVKSNEHVVDHTPSCQHPFTSDHQPGDQASQVIVTVTVTCTEEVYDYQEALQIIRANLSNTAKSDLGTNYSQYQLDGQISVSPPSITVVAKNGQLTIQTQAMGLWVYQFTDQMQSNLKPMLLKLSKQDALSYLQHYMGVASATIMLSSGNIMPTDAGNITLTIQKLPSPQATITPGPQGTLTSSTPMSTLSGTGTSTPTPTPDLGGS